MSQLALLLPGAPSFPHFSLSPALCPSCISWGPLQLEKEPSGWWLGLQAGVGEVTSQTTHADLPSPLCGCFPPLWGSQHPLSALGARGRVH